MQTGGARVTLGHNPLYHPDTKVFVSTVRGIVQNGRTVDHVLRK